MGTCHFKIVLFEQRAFNLSRLAVGVGWGRLLHHEEGSDSMMWLYKGLQFCPIKTCDRRVLS